MLPKVMLDQSDHGGISKTKRHTGRGPDGIQTRKGQSGGLVGTTAKVQPAHVALLVWTIAGLV